jgi:chromosome segregation ATPase
MPDDLLHVLTRFHREVVMPDVKSTVDDAVGSAVGGLRNEMLTHFDGIYHRFDRLETEYLAITAGLGRLEKQMDALEKRMAAMEKQMTALEKRDVRHELEDLKARVADLQQRIVVLEASL